MRCPRLELVDGHRVEELVGDDDARPRGDGGEGGCAGGAVVHADGHMSFSSGRRESGRGGAAGGAQSQLESEGTEKRALCQVTLAPLMALLPLPMAPDPAPHLSVSDCAKQTNTRRTSHVTRHTLHLMRRKAVEKRRRPALNPTAPLPRTCICRSAGLTSTKCTSSASRNPANPAVARSASAASVPRPGPSSMNFRVGGRPSCSQSDTTLRAVVVVCRRRRRESKQRGRMRWRDRRRARQMPISSPNIWDTSGEVTKSPARACTQGSIVSASLLVAGPCQSGRKREQSKRSADTVCSPATPNTSLFM